MTEKAFAKINLFLSVGNRRADGYHDIDTVMHTVSLYDEVCFEKCDTLRVFCDMDVPEKENLAYKAAQAFFEYTGITPSVKITVKKFIPSKAGLGGGSADAAAVLRGLNEMYKAGLDIQTLARIGAPLGADIPFCVYGGKARCEGIGEIITPMEKETLYLAIVKPDVDCPTGKMYSLLDEKERETVSYKENLFFNSFDAVCPEECKKATERLLALGAKNAMLSGSGSAVFGVFQTEADAISAAETLEKEYPFSAYAHTI
ncbi:MAG: 4-(cytidine 5'-diphospho)-2-C-methyl-D-erythritol kinase [Clostridia bacterium]|nr:4-(cytidine 5'-diphospho)-2-C-methyl-D-erythritol kinase [Clostridia bacterium]MBO7246178.1 4-(cytidine 5'-diphospho)-2-C-methyl-D-erythritol kinase [Clostridia bacterium]